VATAGARCVKNETNNGERIELFPRRAKKQLAGTLSGGGRPELIMFDDPRSSLRRLLFGNCFMLCVCWNQKGLTMY